MGKTFHVLVKIDGTDVGAIADHELVAIQHNGKVGFMSKTIYDELLSQEKEFVDLLSLLGVDLPTDSADTTDTVD